ncbi:MAG TPA: 1,4-alpha-glucan branching protein GlgB [Vicinamibacterales bacterium]|nr:1,4-alpha-glucan branching protein GlgB [Vicinamibacterales bacterium]
MSSHTSANRLDRALSDLAAGRSHDPFALLGPHAADPRGTILRVLQPAARAVEAHLHGAASGAAGRPGVVPLARRGSDGLFEALIPSEAGGVRDYRLRVTFQDGTVRELDDPYRFGRVLTDYDLHLLGEGTHYRSYRKLGAHVLALDGVDGVHFAVWAPNAERVSVVGDFNGWDGRVHPMRVLVPNGVWEIFIPALGVGEKYKFEIRTRDGRVQQKVDPHARFFEVPPRSASIVWSDATYQWGDEGWMTARAGANHWLDRPMSIYEVHFGSWARVPEEGNRQLTYRELAERLIPYVKDLGCTHVELLPVMEHPFSGSWGYQVIGFFAPTSRHGTPDDFKAFVDACHQAGLGVILDWVPGHFPKDAHGLAQFDGTALYEHADPRQGEHREWGTLVFNFGRNEVRNFLLSSALSWLGEFHVDGLRVDAVASMLYLDYSRPEGAWIPNERGGRENLAAIGFLQQMNTLTHAEYPGTITVAEESTAWPGVSRPVHLGGLGFTYKWNMGWMHDILEYAQQDPIYRRWGHNHLTFAMLYAYTENFILPFSHDEVVHGKRAMLDKMPGDSWQKAANLRALYGFMFGHPGKKLLFMGNEFGQWHEWNAEASLDWDAAGLPPHAGIRRFTGDLNACYRREPSLHQIDFDPAGFQWIDCNDHENSVVSFIRRAVDPTDFTVLVFNFTPVPRDGYRIGVPEPGFYRELLNSDGAAYGGGDLGNLGGAVTEPVHAHGWPQSLRLMLPPLSCLILKPARPA